MTFREPVSDETAEVGKTALPVVDETTAEATLGEPMVIPEERLEPLPAKGEDPVRLYLKEIGKVPLLTARQEVEIGQRIERGLMRAAGGALETPPTTDPDMCLPSFRVRGTNPAPHPDMETLINAMVAEFFNRHATQAHVALLSLACWQITARLIFAHENGGDRQFSDRGAERRRFDGRYYGHETDMPLFGPPHGYGFGQLDDPPTTDDTTWSFFENIREAVRRIMNDKARGAYSLIGSHMPATPNQRIRAIYQREIVRRYNGGTEFRWNGTDWEIHPSLRQWANGADHSQGANPRLRYPNQVLGVSIIYSVGAGASTTFPWPITFGAGDYGPNTN